MTPIIIAPSTTTTKTTTITTTISTRTRPIRIIKPSSPLVSTFKWPCPVSVAWPVSRPDRRRRRRHCLRRRLRITTADLLRHRACPALSSSLAMLPRPRPRPLLTSIIGRNGISLPCSSSSIATSHHPPPAPPPRTPGIITAMITRCTAGIKSTFASLAASPMPARPRWRPICARIRARNPTGEENEDVGGGGSYERQILKTKTNYKKVTKKYNHRICRNKRPPRNNRPPKTVIFQRGEYTKPMAFDGWFFKGGSTQNRWLLMGFGIFFASKN